MEILSRTQSKKNPIIVQLKEYKGLKLCDIRRFFLEDNSGEYKPTQKGIALSKENFYQILKAIEENWDKVNEWFGQNRIKEEKTDFPSRVEEDCITQEKAKLKARYNKLNLKLEVLEEKRFPFPYKYEARGSLHLLKENIEHPLHRRLSEALNKNNESEWEYYTVRKIIRVIFFTYFLAMERVESISRDQGIDREKFEHEWNQLLKAYFPKGISQDDNSNE